MYMEKKNRKERNKITLKKSAEGFPTVRLCKLRFFFFPPSLLLNGNLSYCQKSRAGACSQQRPSTNGSLWCEAASHSLSWEQLLFKLPFVFLTWYITALGISQAEDYLRHDFVRIEPAAPHYLCYWGWNKNMNVDSSLPELLKTWY